MTRKPLVTITFMWQSEECVHVVTLIIKGTILLGMLISMRVCTSLPDASNLLSGFRIWLMVSGPSISKSKEFPAWVI